MTMKEAAYAYLDAQHESIMNMWQELVMMVRTGSILKIFPYAGTDGGVVWYSSVDRLPAEMDSGLVRICD